MKRRTFLAAGAGFAFGSPLVAAVKQNKFNAAANVLARATSSGQVEAASLYVRHSKTVFTKSFGKAGSKDAIFLLASISKPISIAAVMTLYDRELFDLEDPVQKFIPEFKGDERDRITVRQLLTHVSGLPDQLPENSRLRASHAELSQFVGGAIRTPLLFEPGTRYSYSSMAILLATEVARRITGKPIAKLVDESVFGPLDMKHSALGVGRLQLDSLMRCQVENAAPESGAGDPSTKDWDWNSVYWRKLGVPWGGAHGSAADVARFLEAFLRPEGKLLQPETARLMIRNHNPQGVRPRGLAFDVGPGLGGPKGSERVFGHSGSTGTLCWADPATDTVCVVLTTLPARAVKPHPRNVTSKHVAEAVS
ncbi:MAG: serine hydrolase domain-containing protein [Pirellulaceae bacterium]|jgi:CubicO group peptidase (beta-lactamase class C family)|nr:serine hydrolase domain-containing protein [Pirellulaceae bacterium]MDP7018569.1 serine hydrolase domain-containing protein [Pirellulaceae bacterium]